MKQDEHGKVAIKKKSEKSKKKKTKRQRLSRKSITFPAGRGRLPHMPGDGPRDGPGNRKMKEKKQRNIEIRFQNLEESNEKIRFEKISNERREVRLTPNHFKLSGVALAHLLTRAERVIALGTCEGLEVLV
jgi:hypothetical protein